MGKKKRNAPDVEEILQRPWCYYCERDFDDLKILISHQKAKHFKCERCGRRLNTAGGLSVHMSQVHKETLASVDNALPNRAGLDVEIFGMEGIPEEVIQAHQQRVLTQFHQAEAERRAATGNPGPGGVGSAGNAAKKAKFESPADLKKRLADHKAKVAAEQAAGVSSGDATPLGAGQSPPVGQSPGAFAGSPPFPSHQQPFNGAPGPPPAPFTPPFGQPGPYQQPPGAFHQQPQPPQTDFAPPPFQQFPPPVQSFPHNPYGPPGMPSIPPQFQNGPPVGLPPGPPRGYGTTSPSVPFYPNQHQSPRTQTPPQNGSFPPRMGSLPPAPGLPQRPVVSAPTVNAFQMQQMHQGQLPGSFNSAPTNSYPAQDMPPSNQAYTGYPPTSSSHELTTPDVSANATSLDDLVSNAAKEADEAAQKASVRAEERPREEKIGKKEKDKSKATKLVYSDNEVSPEEKMAKLSRYAFVPDHKDETTMGEAVHATVAGVVQE